ncbi:MAG: ATP-binding protein [Patescibacteria group bacterium]
MNQSIAEYINICQWDPAGFFIFSDNVFGTLVYYSHLLPLFISLIFATFVFFKNPKSLSARWLFVTTALLAVWLFSDLVLWATEKPSFTMFFWSMLVLIEPLIYAGMLFFMYALIDGRDIPFKHKLIIFLLLVPTVLLTPTSFALVEYDLSNCWREAIEGPLAFYGYAIEVFFSLWILVFGIRKFIQKKDPHEKRKVILAILATVLFLLSFAMGNVVGSLLVDWEIGQYGLFGIPVFVAMLAYLVVRYKEFNIKLIATQVLMATIWLLVMGILFVRTIENTRIITALTLILVTVAGDLLIKSVNREVKQREQLAELIKQRESLVHLVTHKVKGSFTRSKYIFAGLLDGTFGDISPTVKKYAEQGLESNDMGIETVDLVLNADNLQKGIVKYDMKNIDLKEIVQKIISEKKVSVETKGLQMESDIGEGSYLILGDQFWLKEVINNLIENSIKYTKAGIISVKLERMDKKIRLSVRDTGIGITDQDKKNLFTEGGRGKDSVKVNVDSTGYGLYSVKLIADAHKGKVWAESQGPGKGAQFYVELDAI